MSKMAKALESIYLKIDNFCWEISCERALRKAKFLKVPIYRCSTARHGDGFVFEVPWNHTKWFHPFQGIRLAHPSYLSEEDFSKMTEFFEKVHMGD